MLGQRIWDFCHEEFKGPFSDNVEGEVSGVVIEERKNLSEVLEKN